MGLQKILSLLEAEDADVRIHAVKVVANLAAEGNKLLHVISSHLFYSQFIWQHKGVTFYVVLELLLLNSLSSCF